MFVDGRTDISDYSTTLAILMKNSGAWFNSGFRQETSDILRGYMDAQPKEKLKDCLRILNDLTNRYGFAAASSAMELPHPMKVLTSVMHLCWPHGLPITE